jgi:hypothetical protein
MSTIQILIMTEIGRCHHLTRQVLRRIKIVVSVVQTQPQNHLLLREVALLCEAADREADREVDQPP